MPIVSRLPKATSYLSRICSFLQIRTRTSNTSTIRLAIAMVTRRLRTHRRIRRRRGLRATIQLLISGVPPESRRRRPPLVLSPNRIFGSRTGSCLIVGCFPSTQREPTPRLRLCFNTVQAEVSVFLQEPLVIVEELHGVVGLETIGFYGLIDLRFQQTHQLKLVPLSHRKYFTDGAALDHFLDVPTGFFVRIKENMHFCDAAKQVVQIAHDILVSAHHEEAEIINFSGLIPV